MENEMYYNRQTGRMISIYGKKYRDLLKLGLIEPNESNESIKQDKKKIIIENSSDSSRCDNEFELNDKKLDNKRYMKINKKKKNKKIKKKNITSTESETESGEKSNDSIDYAKIFTMLLN